MLPALAGCPSGNTFGAQLAGPLLPDLPPAIVVDRCKIPAAKAGDDARAIAARAAAAAWCEKGRADTVVGTYQNLQRGLAGK